MLRWALVSCVLFASSVASAQSDLESARAAFDRAEFEAAVGAFDAAANGDGLSRSDVISLLEGRAIARQAARDVAGAENDLTALLSLEPDRPLSENAPPTLQRAFARLRGDVRAALSVVAEASRVPDGFTIRTRVVDDVASLVREVRVRWNDGGEWHTEVGREVTVPSGPRIRFYVEAIGPGGAVIASHRSEADPELAEAIEGAIAQPPPPPGDDSGIWIGLGIGAAVVVVATVAIILAIVFAPPPRTQPTAPMELP